MMKPKLVKTLNSKAKTLIVIFILGCLGLIASQKAFAFVDNSAGVPIEFPNAYDGFSGTGCLGNYNAGFTWFSDDVNSAIANTLTIDQDSTNNSKTMRANVAGSNCNNNFTNLTSSGTVINTELKTSSYIFDGPITENDTNLSISNNVTSTTSMVVSFDCAHFFAMRYAKTCAPSSDPNTTPVNVQFTLNGLVNLPVGTTTVNFAGSMKAFNKFIKADTGNTVYRCVGDTELYLSSNPLADYKTLCTSANIFSLPLKIEKRHKYVGNLKIQKVLYSDPGNLAASTSSPGNATVGWNNNNGDGISGCTAASESSTANAYTKSLGYVTTCDIYSATGSNYNAYTNVPYGWRVVDYVYSPPAGKPNNTSMTCTGPNNTGTCTVSKVRIYDDDKNKITNTTNALDTYVSFRYEPAATLAIYKTTTTTGAPTSNVVDGLQIGSLPANVPPSIAGLSTSIYSSPGSTLVPSPNTSTLNPFIRQGLKLSTNPNPYKVKVTIPTTGKLTKAQVSTGTTLAFTDKPPGEIQCYRPSEMNGDCYISNINLTEGGVLILNLVIDPINTVKLQTNKYSPYIEGYTSRWPSILDTRSAYNQGAYPLKMENSALLSKDGRYFVKVMPTGNLQSFFYANPATYLGYTAGTANAANTGGCAQVISTGQLTLYKPDCTTVLGGNYQSSLPAFTPVYSQLSMQNDGNVVLYNYQTATGSASPSWRMACGPNTLINGGTTLYEGNATCLPAFQPIPADTPDDVKNARVRYFNSSDDINTTPPLYDSNTDTIKDPVDENLNSASGRLYKVVADVPPGYTTVDSRHSYRFVAWSGYSSSPLSTACVDNPDTSQTCIVDNISLNTAAATNMLNTSFIPQDKLTVEKAAGAGADSTNLNVEVSSNISRLKNGSGGYINTTGYEFSTGDNASASMMLDRDNGAKVTTSTTDNGYVAKIVPDVGYKITNVQFYSDNVLLPPISTGTCDTSTFTPQGTYFYGNTQIKCTKTTLKSGYSVGALQEQWEFSQLPSDTKMIVSYEKLPDGYDIAGRLRYVCPATANTNISSSTESGKVQGKVTGWAVDYSLNNTYSPINNPGVASDVQIVLDEGKPNQAIINTPANVANINDNPNIGTYHNFMADVPLNFYDGASHTISVYPLRGGQRVGTRVFDALSGFTNVSGSAAPYTFSCPPPQGQIKCMTQNDTTGVPVNYIVGWGINPQSPASSPGFKITYDGTGTAESASATKLNYANPWTGTANDIQPTLPPLGFPGTSAATNYVFISAVPTRILDGNNHTVNVKVLYGTNGEANLTPNPLNIGPSIACGSTNLVTYNYPWLQTKGGDVEATGGIFGQQYGNSYPGARSSSDTEKEAEFLVLAGLGGGNSFCSTYNYILTNNSATSGNCDNGTGYGVLNNYTIGGTTLDLIIAGVSAAYNSNGAGSTTNNANIKCNPYNTSSLSTQIATTGVLSPNYCAGGTIYKITDANAKMSTITGAANNLKLTGGVGKGARVTLYVTGSFLIDKDVLYDVSTAGTAPTATYTDPFAIPNLAIVVDGDVNIAEGVRQIDAIIYAKGKIDTCGGATATLSACFTNRLKVNGSLVAKNGIAFDRINYAVGRTPAELIVLNPLSVAYPPPGINSLYFSSIDNSGVIDSAEYQPRF